MKKRTRFVRLLIRPVFLPGLVIWGLVVRLGMLVTKLTSGISLQGRLLVLALRGYRHWTSLQPQSLESVRTSQDAVGKRIRTAPLVEFEEIRIAGRPAIWAIPAKDSRRIDPEFPEAGEAGGGKAEKIKTASRGEKPAAAPEVMPAAAACGEKPARDEKSAAAEYVSAGPRKAILYFHGGGYTTGSIVTHKALVSHIAGVSGIPVLSVGYRLAPENPHPAAFDDAIAAYRWLLSRGYSPGNIALAGDSAGGGLAMSLLVFLRDSAGGNAASRALPACAALLSPWVDLSDSRESWEKLAKSDWLLTPESLQDDARKYLGAPDPSCSDLRDPYVSPRYADLHGLPPLLVHVGGDELLREDIRAFVAKAKASGVKVCFAEWPGMFHDWHLVASYLPEGRRAVDEVGIFLKIMLA